MNTHSKSGGWILVIGSVLLLVALKKLDLLVVLIPLSLLLGYGLLWLTRSGSGLTSEARKR